MPKVRCKKCGLEITTKEFDLMISQLPEFLQKIMRSDATALMSGLWGMMAGHLVAHYPEVKENVNAMFTKYFEVIE